MLELQVHRQPQFSFSIGRAGGAVVVTVHGEVNAANVETLGRVLRDLIDDQGNLALLVDLRDVPTVDPSAVDLFSAASGWAARHGATFSLRRGHSRSR